MRVVAPAVVRRPVARRTALSVLLTVLVLVLAGAAGVLLDRQAAPVPAGPVRTLDPAGAAGPASVTGATDPGTGASSLLGRPASASAVDVGPARSGTGGARHPGVPPSGRGGPG